MDHVSNRPGLAGFSAYLDERPGEGVRRLDRGLYTDPELFALEIDRIFEGGWLFLAHESQIPYPGNFLTLTLGRQPVIVCRDERGHVAVYINACPHHGATLLRESQGSVPDFSCPSHGWCFNLGGELVAILKERDGAYPPQFDKRQHGLTRPARVDSYRGFIFASLNADVPSLADHLGPAARCIDLLVDQSEEGLELLRGQSTYTYPGNWKLQLESGVDGYHVHATHATYIATADRRRARGAGRDAVHAMQLGRLDRQKHSGYFDLGRGHVMLWGDWPNPQDRPNFRRYDEYRERLGEAAARWMVGRLRNLLIYPNLLLLDHMSTQVRVIRPLAVDLTEVTTHAIAPRDEDPDERRRRIRQYEDFFNASGMATPDDLSEFSQRQLGCNGRAQRWSDFSRGLARGERGSGQLARELGLTLNDCGSGMEDEGAAMVLHRRWLALMDGAAGH
ncbi:MAG: benzoate 1,2-dioxygenase large subunit [Immundisolibacter sp.]